MQEADKVSKVGLVGEFDDDLDEVYEVEEAVAVSEEWWV